MAFIPKGAAPDAAPETLTASSPVNWENTLIFELNCSADKVKPCHGGEWKQTAWLSRGQVVSNGKSAFLSFSLSDCSGVKVTGFKKGPKLTSLGEKAVAQGLNLQALDHKTLFYEGLATFEWEPVLLTQEEVDLLWEEFTPVGLNPPRGSFTLPGEVLGKARAASWKGSFKVAVSMDTAVLKNPAKSWVNQDGDVQLNSLWEFSEFEVEFKNSIPMGTPVPNFGQNLQEILAAKEGVEALDFSASKALAYMAKFGSQLGTKLGNKAHKIHLQALTWGNEEVQEIALLRLAQLAAHPSCKLGSEKILKMVKEVDPNLSLPEVEENQPQEVEPSPLPDDEEVFN